MKHITRGATLAASVLVAGLVLTGCDRGNRDETANRTDSTASDTATTTRTDTTDTTETTDANTTGGATGTNSNMTTSSDTASTDTASTDTTQSDTSSPATTTGTSATTPSSAPENSAGTMADESNTAATATATDMNKKTEVTKRKKTRKAKEKSTRTETPEGGTTGSSTSGVAIVTTPASSGGTTTEPGFDDQAADTTVIDPTIGSSRSGATTPNTGTQPGAINDADASKDAEFDVESDAESDANEDESSLSGSTVSVTDRTSKNRKTDGPATTYSDSSAATAATGAVTETDADRMKDMTNPAKALEPQSKYPDKTGSTSITGVPRSHAQAGSELTVFTDPTVAPLRDKPLYEKVNASAVNLEQYSYEKRAEFKDDMEDRLDGLESRIEMIRIDVAEEPRDSRSIYRDKLNSLAAKHRAVEGRLRNADGVPSTNWESYKIEFRDQIADLERSYESLRTAMQ